jgi:hypothetical protein
MPAKPPRFDLLVVLALATAIVLAALPALATPVRLPASEPVVDVLDPATLARLEADGFGLGDVLGVPAATTTAALSVASPAFRTLSDTVAADIDALRAEMAATGRPLFEVTDGNVGRVLDRRWLASPIAGFRLVAVVNRLDRRDFADLVRPGESCGEVRLIYRLAYSFERPAAPGRPAARYASQMPVALNVVFAAPRSAWDGDCAAFARAFLPAAPVDGADAVAAFLAAGPLDRARLALKQIEVNAQIVRFPSGLETTFGGQAVYLMRVFAADATPAGLVLRERRLENTPDVARIAGDDALKARLVDYVRANVAAIDAGVFALPDDLAARRVFSFSTYGSARAANRPFSQLLTAADLAGAVPADGLPQEGLPEADLPEADLSGDTAATLSLVRSPEGLIARLDQATCTGCHQAGATAGFHVLGLADADASPLNRLALGISPHAAAERPRRAAYVATVAAGAAPNRFRAPSAAPPADWSAGPPVYAPAGAGMLCALDASGPDLAATWSCAAGLACTAIAGEAGEGVRFGQCLPPPEQVFSGLPCLDGSIVAGAEPWLDRFEPGRQLSSFDKRASPTGYTCRPPVGGAPGGLAYRQCDAAGKAFRGFSGGRVPDEVCGLAGGKAFDRCVASNNFADCLKASVQRGNRMTCGGDRFCREDFLCQAFPADVPNVGKLPAGTGFCSPTYFLFQLRLDGHPDPVKGLG